MSFDIAAKRAALSPDRPAVWWEGRWLSYAEMNERANRLALRLAEAGVAKGDRVSILAHNHVSHLDLILATAKLGFVYAPFNHRLAGPEQREIARYLRPLLLFHDAENAGKAEVTGLPLVSLDDYEAWLGSAQGTLRETRLDAEDCQMILLTGGTTGSPKGAMQPYRQGFYNAVNTVFSWGLREDDCVIQATPCFHAAVNAFTVPLLHLGARIVLQQSFEPGEYLRLARQHGASILFMVPTMFKMLADHPEFKGADLSSVRWAISGGAPCPAPVREAFRARGVRFKQGYGLTEAGVNCFSIELDDAEARPDAVGRPVLHAQAVIRDERGQPLPPGEVGDLTLAGPHLFSGYFERPEATAEVLKGGSLWTGDLARQDADGFFYIAGRRKEMFISGGENVFPVEIENALYGHPAVSECAVLGVPDDRWGEVGLAVLVLRAGQAAGAAEIKEYLRAQLANYKLPKHIRVVEALPKSAAGKILKTELAAAFADERARGDNGGGGGDGGGDHATL